MSRTNSTFNMIKLGLILAAYAVVSCTVLALVNNLTAPVIAQNKINKANQSMKIVFETADSFEEVTDYIPSTDSSITINNMYLAKNGGNVLGAVTQVTGPTYDRGTIIVGVDLNGTVTGLQILELSDSPGFGLKANDPTFHVANGNTFYGQFTGLNVADGFKAGETFDAISGATITSNAIAALVNQGTYSAVKYLEAFGGQAASADAPSAGESISIFSFEDAIKDICEEDSALELSYVDVKGNIIRSMLVEEAAVIYIDESPEYAAVQVAGQTYSEDGGSVVVVVDKSRTIVGARIVRLNDSPNYGMGTAKPSFYSQFDNRSADENILAGSYDSVSGASISSDCIADMVKVAAYKAAGILSTFGGDEAPEDSQDYSLNEHYLEE